MFYVRSLYKFSQKLSDEISLHVGDVIVVDHALDDNWYIGSNLKNEHGTFPINYVERISIPQIKGHEKLFAAIKDFSAPEFGDLKFYKGDIIKGISEIDENWWSGVVHDEANNEVGIFPLTHVVVLNNHLSDEFQTEDSVLPRDEFDIYNSPVINNSYNDLKAKSGHKRSGSWYNQSNTKSLDTFVKPYAKALYPYEARDRDELSFVDNEIIHLLQHLPGGWSKGNVDGREGLFPTNYVEIIVDCSQSIVEIENVNNNLNPVNCASDVVHYDKAGELYGRILCNFSSSCSDQIDLKEGDTVTILKKIDDDWYRARHDDGRMGFCPSSCMEIFRDEPDLVSPVIKEQFEKPALKPKPSLKYVIDNARPKHSNINDNKDTVGKLVNDFDIKEANLNEIKLTSSNKPKFNDQRRVQCQSSSNQPSTPDAVASTMDIKQKLVPTRSTPTINKSVSSDLIQFSPVRETKSPNSIKSPSPKKHFGGSIPQLNFKSSPARVHIKPIPRPDMKPAVKPPEVAKSDRKDKVLEELVKTESDYLTSLELCKTTFDEGRISGFCPSNIDLDGLFGNIEEVIELSRALLQSLDEITCTAFSECGNVGQCFLRLESDFKRVYAPYCRNHDSVLALLEKYEGDKDAQTFLKKMTDSMKDKIVVFDLASILIKPVQRILKYPLLLSELDKSTNVGMPSKEDISSAVQCMTNIALYINEFKRKQDLVSKYKYETDEKLSDRIQKINIHSTKKKLARIGQMIVGVQTIDEDFNREEHTFKSIENLVRNLIKDLNNFITNYQECSTAILEFVAEVSIFYGSISSEFEIDSMKDDFENVIKGVHFEFKSKTESEIVPSLNSLLVMFRGPSKVIKKRLDKLLDYENCARAISTDALMKEQNNRARSNYEALNSQLLDELPKMNKLSLDILRLLVARIIELKEHHHGETSRQMKRMMKYKFMAPGNEDLKLNVAQQFNIGHTAAVDLLSHLTFVPFTFNPMAYKLKKSRRLTMDDSLLSKVDFDPLQGNIAKLASKYPPYKLFRVSKYFSGSQAMDMKLTEGRVVAVVKEVDPMGNRERWFIDDASSKGFILKNHLEPYLQARTPLQSTISSPPSQTLSHLEFDDNLQHNSNRLSTPIINSRHPQLPVVNSPLIHDFSSTGRPPSSAPSYSTRESSMTNNISSHHPHPHPSPMSAAAGHGGGDLNSTLRTSMSGNLGTNQKRVKVLYSFSARSDLELSVSKGQICTLLQTCDLTGNRDWWFISDDDKKSSGYVPANYLIIIQS